MLRIAIQGIEGSYSAAAARTMFDCALVECPTFSAAIDSIRTFEADFAVLPFRNTICGLIVPVSELLAACDLEIAGEIEIRIDHVLVAKQSVTFDLLAAVLSHPAALEQCSKFLQKHSLRAIAASDTATAVKYVMENPDKQIAAIASWDAAAIYEASILAENIADAADNRTLFYAVSRKNAPRHR